MMDSLVGRVAGKAVGGGNERRRAASTPRVGNDKSGGIGGMLRDFALK